MRPAFEFTPESPVMRSSRKLGTTRVLIRDLALIALAWTVFIGVILYPAAQLVGLLACAIALGAERARRGKLMPIKK
jgi:hypothetical protein